MRKLSLSLALFALSSAAQAQTVFLTLPPPGTQTNLSSAEVAGIVLAPAESISSQLDSDSGSTRSMKWSAVLLLAAAAAASSRA